MELWLGDERFDVTHRGLVMGILNRTRDSFYDRGAHFRLEALLRAAENQVRAGADILDVGGAAAGVATEDVSDAEEIDRVVPAIAELRRRFDLPLSVDTWKAPVAAAAFEAGAVVGNDMSGFSHAEYLEAAAAAGASVVATHIRLAPRVADPEPVYGDVVEDVRVALVSLARRAREAGIPSERVMVDPGLDLGKTWQQSVRLLARCDVFADLGHVLLLAPSNKIFLGRLLGLGGDERREATLASCAVAAVRGARVLRVHEPRGARQALDVVAAVLAEG